MTADTHAPRDGAAPHWSTLPDDQLLDVRLCDLDLSIQGSELEPRIALINGELESRGLIRPAYWISDEWFSPDGVPGVAVPFYLLHPRLVKLELAQMLEVEGGDEAICLKILRHEAGHAVDNAYQLRRRRARREIFGLPSTRYPEYYTPKPYSKSFVQHLDHWYAQSHPDEDFAETFAVWLTPGLDWRKRYAGWKALQKLEYVDELMGSLAGKPPASLPGYRAAEYDCLGVKLKTYYARKRKAYEHSFPDFYDNDLRQLFDADPKASGPVLASEYLRRHRHQLTNAVCQWTNENRYRVDQLVTRIINRCDALGLHIRAYDPKQNLHVSAYITTLVMNHLFTGKFKRTK